MILDPVPFDLGKTDLVGMDGRGATDRFKPLMWNALAKMGFPGKDSRGAWLQTYLRDGKYGIECWCYEDMPDGVKYKDAAVKLAPDIWQNAIHGVIARNGHGR